MAHQINRRNMLSASGAAVIAAGVSARNAAATSFNPGREGTDAVGGGGGEAFTNPPGTSGWTREHMSNALAAVSAFKSGAADFQLAMIGDSNLAGVGAGEEGVGGSAKIRNHSPARKLRDRLRAAGVAATDDSWWGNGNFTLDYFPYTEPRLSFTNSVPANRTGWSFAAPDGPVIGGLGLLTQDMAGTVTWQCVDTQTHMRVKVECSPGFGVLEYSVDGGAHVGTIDLSKAAPPGLNWVTVDLGGEGVHSVTFRGAVMANRVALFALDFYNVRVKRVRIWPWFYSGGTLLNIKDTDYATQGAHLAIINNWINDRGGPFPGATTATVVNALKAKNCDVLLENPVPTTPPDTFAAAGLSLAETLGVPYIDMTWKYATNQAWARAGFGQIPDKHSNDAGYERRTEYTWACVRQLFGV